MYQGTLVTRLPIVAVFRKAVVLIICLGVILSAQSGAYGVSKFAVGVWSSGESAAMKGSSEVVFAGGLALSSTAVLAMSAVDGSTMALAVLAFANGIAQGAAWPTCVNMLRRVSRRTVMMVRVSSNNVR